jgi:glutamate-1-semialdehyde aminotransferase
MEPSEYERLASFGSRIKETMNSWADENGYPFFMVGRGSHLGYEFADKPGRTYRSCRDIVAYGDKEKTEAFAFELATRGLVPMHRGQIALSQPMTDVDIDVFITLAQEIVQDMCPKQ